MTVWGDCAVTENADGTWTYSPNRKPVSFGGIVNPATTGAMFIIESAKGYLSALGTEDATGFPQSVPCATGIASIGSSE